MKHEHPLFAWFYEAMNKPAEWLGAGGMNRMRSRLVSRLDGRVLEVGVGNGLNLSHYTEAAEIVGLEPDPHMLRRAVPRAEAAAARIFLLAADGEALPFGADTFDRVGACLVLCTVPDPERALSEMRRVLRPGLRRGCVGGVTLPPLARRVGPTGTVVAFEPDDWSVKALEASVAANGLENVRIRPVVVWSTATSVGFEQRKDSAAGAHGAVHSAARDTVCTTTLDDEWAGAAPNLVKIDVEGAEEQVLLGARRLLAEARPTIVCEVHLTRSGSPELPARVRALLEAAGYDVQALDPDRSPLHLLAIPR